MLWVDQVACMENWCESKTAKLLFEPSLHMSQVFVYKPIERRLGLEHTGCLGAVSIVIGFLVRELDGSPTSKILPFAVYHIALPLTPT